MGPYEDEVLEALGLPTDIRRIRDLNYYRLLKVSTAATRQEILEAASKMMRKLRDFEKGRTRDFASELEREIIRARTTLSDPALRQRYNREIGALTTEVSVVAEEVEPLPSERTAFEKRAVPEKLPRSHAWIFWVILLILILLALMLIPWKKISSGASSSAQGISSQIGEIAPG